MKFLFTMLTSLLLSTSAFGATLSATLGSEFDLNKANPNMMAKHQLGTVLQKNRVHVAAATYDFSVLGGAVGAITLRGDNGQPVVIPNKAVIVGCIIDVQTPATTSASGTISLSTGQTAADLKAATAAASYTGLVACVPVGTAATAIKITADRTMVAAIATGAITAGKFTVFVQYILGRN